MKLSIKLSSVKKEENRGNIPDDEDPEIVKLDRRLQRLQRLKNDQPDNQQEPNQIDNRRRRRAFEPVVIEEQQLSDDSTEQTEDVEGRHALIRERLIKEDNDEQERSNDLDENKRTKHQQIVISEQEEESEDESSDESSDEEDSDDEFFNSAPKIKPIFVRKEDRHSIINERKKAEEKAKLEEINSRKAAEDRRKEAMRIIESTVQRERIESDQHSEANFESINSVKTDDESEEVAYLNWKLRELKRNKRDKDEREAMIKLKEETERLRNMTEEEREAELKKNPKVITNQQERGKYKFMQKYYHRGAYFLDEESEIFKRDIAKPTLEDHFDKTVLPKVMQVKNFGRSGQTKYTHLVDQDTTDQSSPWYKKDNQSAKSFFEKHGGGMKQIFERPSKKRKN